MNETKLIPKLRFPEFKDPLSSKKLDEICTFSKGRGISKNNLNDNGTPCIRYGELYTTYNEIIKDVHSHTKLNKEDLTISESNDIILPCSGETAIDLANASCVLNPEIALGGDITIIKTQQNSIYLSYYLNSKRNEIAKYAQGISIMHLYPKDFKKLKLNLPSVNEQSKISTFLSEINSKLEVLNQELDQIKDFKRYLLENIFSQKLRFDFEDEWKLYKLKALCSITKGKQLNKDNMIEEGEYYVINGGINPSGFTDEWNTVENTISISEGGNSCGYVNFNTKKFWSGGHCYTLNSLKNNLDVYYLFSYLKSIEPKIMRLRVGSGLPNIQKEDIESIQIKVPSIEEQNKISNFLLNTDTKINLLYSQIFQMEKFKKGLLQQMFI